MAFPTDCLSPITLKGFFPERHFELQEALFVSINPWAKSEVDTREKWLLNRFLCT